MFRVSLFVIVVAFLSVPARAGAQDLRQISTFALGEFTSEEVTLIRQAHKAMAWALAQDDMDLFAKLSESIISAVSQNPSDVNKAVNEITKGAKAWDVAHNSDRLSAVRWCLYRHDQLSISSESERQMWLESAVALLNNDIFFFREQVTDQPVVTFRETYEWALQWLQVAAADRGLLEKM